MGLVTAKLQETAAHVIAMSVLVLNLRKIQCALLQILAMLRGTVALGFYKENWYLFSRDYDRLKSKTAEGEAYVRQIFY